MARVFVLAEDETGRQTGRRASFAEVLAYVLRPAGPEGWNGTEGLTLPYFHAAAEMEHTYRDGHLAARRSGPRTQKPVLHAILGWHADDRAWLTRKHVTEAVRTALAHMGLADHQCVWALHTDTGRPHVHLVANLVHPVTGDVARLGLIKKRMSAFCADYERQVGQIRCRKRMAPKTTNENRKRLGRTAWSMKRGREKQKADTPSAPRP